jgi:hypothetical protein
MYPFLGLIALLAVIFSLWKGVQFVSLYHPDVLRGVKASNGEVYYIFDSSYVEKMVDIDNMLQQRLASDVPNKQRYKGSQTLRQTASDSYTQDKKLIFINLQDDNTKEMAIHELAHLLSDSVGHTEEWEKIHSTLFSVPGSK